MKYPPPTSLAMYLRRFYELDFPLLLRQSIGFAAKERLYKNQDFNTPIAQALSTVDPKNLKYVEEAREFRGRIENEKELPVWWHFSIVVRAGDKETLRARRAQVISLLKEIGSFGVPERRNLKAAFMRVSRQETSFHFNPFLPADPLEPVPEDQFEFCMGLLKLIAGPKLATPANEMAMRKGLAEFFNAYRMLLRNQQEQAPVPPLTLLTSILEMEIEHSELASAFELWTVGRRGELVNTGKDTLRSARYCYFDLRDLDGEPELMTAIVYVIFSKVYRDIADERLRPIQKRFVLDEAHRYITDPAFSHWIALLARTGAHWNIMLDLITKSLADLANPDQPCSKALIPNPKQP